jgi:hypothetical protein
MHVQDVCVCVGVCDNQHRHPLSFSQIPNMPLDAYSLVVGEKFCSSYSICISEHLFHSMFDCSSSACYTKVLRYGGVLMPKWPLQLLYSPQKHTLKITG